MSTHLNSLDLGWPLMTLKWTSKFSASKIDPTHQVSCPYTNNQYLPYLTLDDLWWPWSDLQNFKHSQLTPPIKFHVHTPMFTPFDLGWPLMTLKWPSKFLAFTIDPTHQASCPYTNVYPIWPWMTPDDLEVTFKIFGIHNWPCQSTKVCISSERGKNYNI